MRQRLVTTVLSAVTLLGVASCGVPASVSPAPVRVAAVVPTGAPRPTPQRGATATSLDTDHDRLADGLEKRLTASGAPVRAVVSAGGSAASVAATVRARWPHSPVRALAGTGLVAVTLPSAAIRLLPSLAGVRMVEPDLRTWSGPAPKPAGPDSAAPGQPSAPPVRSASVSGQSERDGRQFAGQVAPDIAAARTALGVTGDGDGDPASYSTADTVVAVIDTGIDDQHPAFAGGKVLLHKDFESQPPQQCGAPPAESGHWDQVGHGTHVAGIIAGTGSGRDPQTIAASAGIAPGAALLDLRVLDCTGSGQLSDVDAALGWLLEHHAQYGVRVANLSLGAADFSADGTDSASRLVDRLLAAGVQVVVAAGNSGAAEHTIGTPAAAPFALTVAAANGGAHGEWLAPFSSRGPTGDGRPGIDVTAFGVDVSSALANRQPWDFHTSMSGTSMATPVVSGLVALLAAARPDRHPSATPCADTDPRADCADGVLDGSVRDPFGDLIRSTAQDWFTPGIDGLSGAGILRGGAALATQSGTSAAALPGAVAMPRSSSFHLTLSPGRRIVIPVDATGSAAAVTAVLDQGDGMRRVKLRWLDEKAQENTAYSETWGGEGFFTADDASYNPRQYGTVLPPGAGKQWLEIRSDYGTYELDLLITAAAAPQAISTAVHLETAQSAAEGGSAGSVDLVLDADLDHRYTFQPVGDGQLSPSTSPVSVGPAPAGTRIRFAAPAVDDSTPEGRHTGLFGLVPAPGSAADTPVLRTSVPIADNDDGTPAATRILAHGSEITGGLYPFWLGPVLVADDGTIVTEAFSDQLRLEAGEVPGSTSTYAPVVVKPGQADATPIPLGAHGSALPAAQVQVLGLSADGSRVLIGMPGWVSGAVDGDTDALPELFVHDLHTGQNTRVGFTPAQRAGLDPATTVISPGSAVLSADGSTVAFVGQDPAEVAAGTWGLWVSAVGDAQPHLVRTVSSIWLQGVTA
ncbi:MAG: hypothetical protein QOJ50_1097, partial [Cryptosporangiaceae bacterium]|nr:hypothetical protein [Cryptosporangiaceae bacterium]